MKEKLNKDEAIKQINDTLQSLDLTHILKVFKLTCAAEAEIVIGPLGKHIEVKDNASKR